MINFQANVSGEYRIVTYKDDGSIDYDSGYFDNLITNYGLDSFGGSTVESLFPVCFLAPITTPWTIANTATAFPSGTTGSIQSTGTRTSTSDVKVASGYIEASSEYRYGFNAPVAATTYTHVGVGKDATHLGSVAPMSTPLTVSGGSAFDVFWKLTIKYPVSSKTTSATLGTTSHTCVLSPIGASNVSTATHGWKVLDYPFKIDNSSKKCAGLVAMVPLISPTDIFYTSADAASIEPNSITYSTYVAGSYNILATLTWNTNGNDSFNVVHFRTCYGKFQVLFTPNFNKTASDQLSITVRISWARS